MIHRFLPAAALPAVLCACGTAPEQQPVDPQSTQEAQALEDAASMLDEQPMPPTAAPADPAAPNNQTPGETR